MADTAEEKRKKEAESITDILLMLYGGSYAYYRPASFTPAVLTSDDESPDAEALVPVAAASGATGATVAAEPTEPETTETVMELRGSDGQLIALNPAVLKGPLAARQQFASNDPRITVSPDLYDKDKNAFWKAKGYDGSIFKETGFFESIFDNDLTDDVLAENNSFIKAAKIVYEAEEGHAWTGSDNKALTDWTMNHMRAIKNNLVVGAQNMWQNSNASQHVQDAFKFVGDAYDQKDWTALGLTKAVGWTIVDPSNLIGGGLIAKAGLKAVKVSGATGFLKRAGEFTAKTVLPAAGLGAVTALADSAIEQNIGYHAGAQERRLVVSRTVLDTTTGALTGAGFSVIGGLVVPAASKIIAPKISKRLSKKHKEAAAPDVEAKDKTEAETPKADEPVVEAEKIEAPKPEDVVETDKIATEPPEVKFPDTKAANEEQYSEFYDAPGSRQKKAHKPTPDEYADSLERAIKGEAQPAPGAASNTADNGSTIINNYGTMNYNSPGGQGAAIDGGAPTGTTRTADAGTDAPAPEAKTKPGKAGDDGKSAETPEAKETAGTVTKKPEATDDAGAKTPEAEKPEATTAGVGEPKNAKKSADDEKIVHVDFPDGAPPPPEFKKIKDWGNQFLFRRKWVYDPYQGWKDYRALRVESAMTNPRPIIKPVVDYADGRMEKWGLTKGLYDLNQSIQNIATSDMKSLQTKMLEKMEAFSDANRENLKKFQAEIKALRKHVELNYKTLKDDNGKFVKNDGRYHGLIETIAKDIDGNGIGHKKALLAYLDDLIKTSGDLQKPDFGDTGKRVVNLEYQSGMPMKDVHALKTHSLHKIFTMVEDAHARLHVHETTTGDQGPQIPFIGTRILYPKRPLKEVNGIKIGVTREERESVIRMIQAGHYEAEPTLKKRSDPSNLEAVIMDLEVEYKKYISKDGNDVTTWPVEDTKIFASALAGVVRDGYGHEALHVARRMMMRVGSGSRRVTIPPNITDNPSFKESLGDVIHTEYYKRWKKSFDAVIDRKHITGKEEEGWGPTSSAGRDSEEQAMERSYFWHYMFRFPGDKPWSKPAEIRFQAIFQNRFTNLYNYAMGGYTSPIMKEGKPTPRLEGHLNLLLWRDKPKEEDYNKWRDNLILRAPSWLKTPTRFAFGGVTYTPIMYATGGSFALVGSEKAYQWAFDDDEDTWMGNTGRWLGQKALYTADIVRDWTVGWTEDVPYLGATLNAVPIEEANEYFFRAGKPERKVSASSGASPVAADQQMPPPITLPAGQALSKEFITGTLDRNIAKRKTEVEIAESALKTAKRDHARLKKIAGKDDSDANTTARDDAETAKNNAQTALDQREASLDTLQFKRTKAVIAFRTSAFKDDPTLQSKITEILLDMQDAGPGISKKFDLLDDALFAGALDLAGKEGEYTKKDLQEAITKVFPADAKKREADKKKQPYSQTSTRPSESFGNMAEDGVNWALDWTGADAKSGWLGRTFNKMGDWGRAFGGFWGDLSTTWKAGIIGVAGFFGVGMFLKKQLGWFGSLPFVGLILGLIGFALTGKAAHAYMNRPKEGTVQGTNGFDPNPTEDSQKHGEKKAKMGNAKTTGKYTVIEGQKSTDTREIETGMYSVQANTSGKKGFAPQKVVYLMTNDGIGDNALEDQAKTASHIPSGLKNVISARDSVFDGITHDSRVLRRTSANDFEYDAPAVA
ncbi:MAG: hypothetical protein H6860_03930 [Rhodospirillales bacterium]|nr:hypothetical protein [Rhodospirillales bacterium]